MNSSVTDSPALSLILPAYNEAAGIHHAVSEAVASLQRLVSSFEVIVVDDGSTDETATVVSAMALADRRIRLLRHEQNVGYGRALRTGFEAAQGARVAFTDADCQFYLEDLAGLLALTETHDLAVGYRQGRQDPAKRCFFSWGYNLLARTLLGTGVRDVDCALKVFCREALAEILPETTGFFVNTEMLTRAQQQQLRVAELGVRHRPRVRGSSKVSLTDIPRTLQVFLPFWWSHVLFPIFQRRQHQALRWQLGHFDLGLLLVLVAAALLFFTRPGCPLQEPEESRYAEIPREMLQCGTLVVPVQDGLPYLDKPPLLYWLVMGSYRLFGIEDRAARVAAGLCGFLTVLATYVWGRRVLSPRAALAGALCLCLSARFVYLGRLLTTNILLCLCVTAALAGVHAAISGSRLRWRYWLLGAVATGLGILTKGPVALLLVIPPVVFYSWLDRRSVRPGWAAWTSYGLLTVGLAAPWYLTIMLQDPSFTGYFFWKQNIVRFLAPFDHEAPAWFYLPELFLGMLPGVLLLPALVTALGRGSSTLLADRPAALGFVLLCFGWCLLFFSLAGCKRAGYILPAMPPLALALGWCLDSLLSAEAAGWRRAGQQLVRLAHYGTVLVLIVALLGGAMAALTGPKVLRAVPLSIAAGLALTVLLSRGHRHSAQQACILCGGITFVLLLAGVHQVLPSYARSFSMRGQVRPHAELASDGSVPVACYPRRWDSVTFYLARSDVRVYSQAQRAELLAELGRVPQTLLFVKVDPRGDRLLDDLLQRLPGALEFVQRGRRGHVPVGLVRRRNADTATLLATTTR